MDNSTKTRDELIAECKTRGIKGYSGKKKEELVRLLAAIPTTPTSPTSPTSPPSVSSAASATPASTSTTSEKINRLNYIGSKFQLLDWITNNIKEKTGWTSFEGKTVVDLFAGTGIVSYHFRKNGARVISNDAELYSSIITHAFTRSTFTETCKRLIDEFQSDLDKNRHADTTGFVTTHYSPHESNERKFFTVDNARRIDHMRKKLETIKDAISDDEYKFLLASILLSADAVSNVPAVYGCYLKNFKTKATKALTLTPIHQNEVPPVEGARTHNSDVLNVDFAGSFEYNKDVDIKEYLFCLQRTPIT